MNPVTVDIKDLIVDAGLGVFKSTSAWGIYIGQEPDTPNDCITLFDSGGPAPGNYFDVTLPETQNVSFQLRVRANKYSDAWVKIRAIIDMLKVKPGFTVEDTAKYGRLFQSTDVISLGEDENERSILVSNFSTMREDTS